jgi:hypothetical protein
VAAHAPFLDEESLPVGLRLGKRNRGKNELSEEKAKESGPFHLLPIL